jgi:hypothetical protein
MEVVEMAMNIFTPEYVVLAAALLAFVYHVKKSPKTDEGAAKSSRNNGKSELLH